MFQFSKRNKKIEKKMKKDEKSNLINETNENKNENEEEYNWDEILILLFKIATTIGMIILFGVITLTILKSTFFSKQFNVLAKVKQVENSNYYIFQYDIEESLKNDFSHIIDENIKKNRRRLIKRPMYLSLSKKGDIYRLETASNKKPKIKNDYKVIKANINEKGKLNVSGFQKHSKEYLIKTFDVSKPIPNTYYKLTLEEIPTGTKIKNISRNSKIENKPLRKKNEEEDNNKNNPDDLKQFFQ